MTLKGVVLAGGLGTRLRPLTNTLVKQLIPIANKPVLEYCIEDLQEAGVKEIGIIVGYTPDRVKAITDAIGDGSRWGVHITYIEQDAPRGIAHAVQCAREFVGDSNFVVYLGDNMIKGGIAPFMEKFQADGVDGGMLLTEVEDPRPYGVVEFGPDGTILAIHEKPQVPPSRMVVIGIYYFSPRVFEVIEKLTPSRRGEYEITDALHRLVTGKQYRVGSACVQGWWDDTGTVEAVLQANHHLMTDLQPYCHGTVGKGVRLSGVVCVGKDTVIEDGTVIRGPVIIGKNCRIGSAYLGPYTAIGDNCVIKGGEIEASIVLGNTSIKLDHNQRILDSLIGRYSVINSAREAVPHGYKLTLGEYSEVQI